MFTKLVRRYWILYGLLFVVCLLTHFLCAAIFLGHAFFFLMSKPHKTQWAGFAWAAGIPIIVVVIWLVSGGWAGIQDILSRSAGYEEELKADSLLATTPFYLAAGVVQDLLHIFGNSMQNFGIRIRWLAVGLVISLVFGWLAIKHADKGVRRFIWMAICVIAAVFLTSIVLALVSGHLLSLRVTYFVMAAPFAAMIIAVGIRTVLDQPGKWKVVSIGLCALQGVIMGVSLKPTYDDTRSSVGPRERNPYAVAAESILETYTAGDVVVYYDWHDAKLMNLYFRDQEIEQRVAYPKNGGLVQLTRNGIVISERSIVNY